MMGGCLCDYGPTGVERGTQALELTQACQNRIAIAAIVLSPTFNHLFQCFAPLRFGILTAYTRGRVLHSSQNGRPSPDTSDNKGESMKNTILFSIAMLFALT